MKDILLDIKSRAALKGKTVVLPEGEDSRVVNAASQTVKEGVSKNSKYEVLERVETKEGDSKYRKVGILIYTSGSWGNDSCNLKYKPNILNTADSLIAKNE